jgi:AAA15 family ATPase/GTPase
MIRPLKELDMLQSIHIQNFKGFKDTEVGPFKKVNLILGGQNVGKTSLLEAVYASTGGNAHSAGAAFRIFDGSDQRRYVKSALGDPNLSLSSQFSNGRVSCVVGKTARASPTLRSNGLTNLASIDVDGGVLSYWSNTTPSETISQALPVSLHLPSQFDQVNLFGRVIITRKKKQLLDLLQKIEPRLEGLDAVSPDGDQRIYADISGLKEALPIQQLGHGFSRLLVLFAQLLVSESRLVLVDEVENGIHYSALPILFEGVKLVAKERDVQSLITTHSWDCLRAACEVFADSPDQFQVIRLEREGDNTRAVCIEGERMLRMMAQDMEVR